MKITKVEVVRSRKPRKLPQEYRAAWFEPDGEPVTTYGFSFYRVHTDAGVTGVGPFGGDPDAFALRALIGSDPFYVERFFAAAMNGREMTFHRGSYGGLEVALWDIMGRVTGQPIHRLLGAHRDRVPVYAATSRLLSKSQHVEQVLELRQMGFRAAKLRLHRQDPREDLEVVEAVRAAVDAGFRIIVDANQNHKSTRYNHWTRETALTMARELQALGVYFLEEPLPRHDLEGLAQLAAAVEIPIAGGEHATNIYELREHILRGAYDILQPDVTLGDMGISGSKRLSIVAGYHGRQIVPHVSGLGSFALNFPSMLQVASTMDNCPILEYPFDPPILTVDTEQHILKTPLLVEKDGCVAVPTGPGIGVEIDEKAVAEDL